jgi:hypothetical protein
MGELRQHRGAHLEEVRHVVLGCALEAAHVQPPTFARWSVHRLLEALRHRALHGPEVRVLAPVARRPPARA